MFVIGWSAACKDPGDTIPLANGRRHKFLRCGGKHRVRTFQVPLDRKMTTLAAH